MKLRNLSVFLIFVLGCQELCTSELINKIDFLLPVVVNTWPFTNATLKAWHILMDTDSPTDAIVEGCTVCEEEQCDLSVGFGGSPDENGETTLDAMIMDGDTMNVGAVGDLRNVKEAIRAAKIVLDHTKHSLIVGDHATNLAVSMGLKGPESLATKESQNQWMKWKNSSCQPNYRVNVSPNNEVSCGPYTLFSSAKKSKRSRKERKPLLSKVITKSGRTVNIDRSNHDTITMVAISKGGSIASGGSTNGLTFKVPGRVGDTPIPGAGSYADSEAGGCGATGDGDIMLRFLPCYQAVENLRRGFSPKEAAEDAIGRIKKKYPDFIGALFVVNLRGEHAGATSNWDFLYSVKTALTEEVQIFSVSKNGGNLKDQ